MGKTLPGTIGFLCEIHFRIESYQKWMSLDEAPGAESSGFINGFLFILLALEGKAFCVLSSHSLEWRCRRLFQHQNSFQQFFFQPCPLEAIPESLVMIPVFHLSYASPNLQVHLKYISPLIFLLQIFLPFSTHKFPLIHSSQLSSWSRLFVFRSFPLRHNSNYEIFSQDFTLWIFQLFLHASHSRLFAGRTFMTFFSLAFYTRSLYFPPTQRIYFSPPLAFLLVAVTQS